MPPRNKPVPPWMNPRGKEANMPKPGAMPKKTDKKKGMKK